MVDFPRLIEFAFPLKQASLDSVHEKNVRHGHISKPHIWPARRPLATVSRADLVVSWNFKHIVHWEKIRGFNAVNLREGYPPIEIRSPREVV